MSDDHRALLDEITALRGELAATRARLAEVELLADRDALTPLLNRRAFLRELKRSLAFHARYGGEAALLYLDMDRFREVNSRFGHAGGDAALKVVADILIHGVRESDLVGRLGGDEFAVLLVRTSEADAEAKARQLAARVAAEPVVTPAGAIALSVTIGVRMVEAGPEGQGPRGEALDAQRLLAEADAAMYLNKPPG